VNVLTKVEAVGDLSRMALRMATSPRDVLATYRNYLWRCTLSTVDYRSLVRDAAYPLVVWPAHDKYGDMTWQEVIIVCMLVRQFQPKRIFEFGTFMGKTTYHLAANSDDDALIFTLDLPETEFSQAIADIPYDRELLREGKRQEVGYYYKKSPFRDKVTQLFANSAKFDETAYVDSMDMVFIDADHSYESVLSDTKKAFRMVSKGGSGKVILWHDLRPHSAVERAMVELSDHGQTFHIKDTALGIYLSQ
jgi:predicted O-methyltransferase YrrM